MSSASERTGLEIAIVGMACHFPGASTLEEFWNNLREGAESISTLSDEQLAAAGIRPEIWKRPDFVRREAILDGYDRFDASFFGYTPREAEVLDPQQRLFLERASEALERSGCNPETFAGTIGVYGGLGFSGYRQNLVARRDLLPWIAGLPLLLGTDKDFMASRVAYKLDLKGPAVSVQTACSTSLVAVHMAVQALLAGECDLALAGGASLKVPHHAGYLHQEEGILSRDGRCRTFDAAGDGTVPGSGVGVVVLKRLADALADGDPIEAVIRGSAVNNDGANRIGYTAPGVEGQYRVVRAAQTLAGTPPETISYLEAHGTATALGDPIEIAALNRVFRSAGPRHACAIGSVKSNFGHLDAAAGIAGLIKTVLCLKHRTLVPSLHFEAPNPNIDFAGGPFRVVTRTEPWTANGHPLRAGVSSFGMGGTNAHVILEEAPALERSRAPQSPEILVLSAKSPSALARAGESLAEHLERDPAAPLADVAHTLQVGRRVFAYRRALVARNSREAALALKAGHRGSPPRPAPAAPPAVVFLFPGQGAQHVGMAKGIYEAEPVFRAEVDRCAESLRSRLGLDLRALLFPEEGRAEEASLRLDETRFTQPALFVVEHALARWWASLGVSPRAMIGHSIGEYAAACLSGVFDLEDALHLVAERGVLMSRCPPGAMLAVEAAPERLKDRLGDEISIAALNAPDLCVVSGAPDAVERLALTLTREGIFSKRLRTSHAFHSALVDPVCGPFLAAVRNVRLRSPRIPFLSNVTGAWITEEQATDPAYWVRQLREPVQFSRGVKALLGDGDRVFLEVGPGRTLVSLVRRHEDPPSSAVKIRSLRLPQEGGEDRTFLLEAVAGLWSAGVAIDWTRLRPEPRRRVPLPTYPFERERYWIDRQSSSVAAPAETGEKKPDPRQWFYLSSWKRAAPLSPAPGPIEPSRVCVLDDGSPLAAALCDRLQESGHQVFIVRTGASFARTGSAGYAIDPGSRRDWETLWDDLAGRGAPPAHFFHFWSFSGEHAGLVPLDAVDAALARSFFSLLFLAQLLAARGSESVSITAVTRGLFDVTGEALDPLQAAVLGPSRVIPREIPSVSCRVVDVLERAGRDETADTAARLLLEWAAGTAETLVAHRGGHRWVPVIEPLSPAAVEERAPMLRERGVYLVTGGLGGIGLAVSEHLARTLRARLVLVSRNGLSGREPAEEIRKRIERLESLGAAVWVARADVADLEAMRSVVAETERRFGTVNGVVHAAGVPGSGLIPLKTAEAAAAVLRPKVQGTLVLSEIFQDRPLDFLLLCSSLTGVLGGLGQVDYAAANAFQDALAQYLHRTRGFPVIAVDWDTWGESGMAVRAELGGGLRERVEEVLRGGMTDAEGVEVFRRALSGPRPQVLISTRDWRERAARAESPRSEPPSTGPATGRTLHARPELQSEYVEPRADLERRLAQAWQELLGIERIGVTDNFFELGGDSLAGLRLVSWLKDSLKVSVPLVILYEAPTIELLVKRLEEPASRRRSLEESGERGRARVARVAQRQRTRR